MLCMCNKYAFLYVSLQRYEKLLINASFWPTFFFFCFSIALFHLRQGDDGPYERQAA